MGSKKFILILVILLLASILFSACSKKSNISSERNYISKEEVKKIIEEDLDDYIFLDLRKLGDYNESHIKVAHSADIDAANNGGDDEAGIESLKSTLKEATGSEKGREEDKYVLICCSGNSYAKKGTQLLIEMGISEEQIFTLKGGMEAWEKGGKDYKKFLE